MTWLDITQKIAVIIASLSIVIVIASYLYQKWWGKTSAVLEQISFFRKEIIPQHDDFINSIRKHKGDKNYIPPRIILEEPAIEFLSRKYPREIQEQRKYQQGETLIKQIVLLNMLEELSLRIIHFKTEEHEALNSIKTPFVEMVELRAVSLLIQKEIVTGDLTYKTVLKVYSRWKNKVARKSQQDIIKEFTSKFNSHG